MILSPGQAQPAFGLDGVRIGEARGAGSLMDRNAQTLQRRAVKRIQPHGVRDLAHTREQSGVVQDRFGDGDTVRRELASLPHQPRSVGQRANRDGSVIRRHAAKLAAGNEHRSRTELRRTARGHHAGWPSAYDQDVGQCEVSRRSLQ